MSYIKKIMTSTAAGIGGALLLTIPAAALVGNNTVTSGDIVDGAVHSADIANGTITASDIANNSVTSDDIGPGQVRSSEIDNNSIVGGDLANDIQIETAATRATGATGSYQGLASDVTYEGAAGGTSYYHAGVMGNFLGDTLTNSTASLHAGVIGSVNVTTSDANPGATAGVVGEVGDLAAGADSAVMAVLGGDGGAVTPNAAYGVQYFNSTAGSHFNYGLDLSHAATTGYTNSAVDYGTADIRLQNGETISNGTDGTIAFGSANLTNTGNVTVTGNVSASGTLAVTGASTQNGGISSSGTITGTGAVNFSGATSLRAPNGAADLTDGADAGSTCAAGNKGDLQLDTGNSLFVCDGTNWQQLDN